MASHPWQFFRAGGFDQVRLATGQDLVRLGELDKKLWVALACPVKGLEFDGRTLEVLDTEKDGRIRVGELIGACTWVGAVLKDPESLVAGKDTVPLSLLAETDEGRRLASSAKAVLSSLGATDQTVISVAQVDEAVKAFDSRPFNGDGVVPPDSAVDPALKALAQEAVDSVGGEKDKSGKQGVSAATVKAFVEELKAHAAWLSTADAKVLPLGDATGAAHAALLAVKAKVDDYFARCRLAAFDARAATALNRDEKDWLPVLAKDLSADANEVKGFPLARVEAGRALPLHVGLNPAWAPAVAELKSKAVAPLLGAKAELTEAQWKELVERFVPYEAWQAKKTGAKVEKLGAARVKALAEGQAQAELEKLLAEEKSQEPLATSLGALERLVRYHRDLFRLANNFASFKDFYERKTPAMFQVGTLYLDQRECQLCLRVEDAARHATLGPLARTYLAYCDLSRPASGEKMSVVAAFTNGDSDNLMTGRNGIFVDRAGKEWDATITRIVDAPISVRQAFWSPYKKLIRFVEEQVAKRAATAESASHDRLTGNAKELEAAAEGGKAPPTAKKIDIGTVAALGVAVGGITAALGAMLEAFFGLGLWMPLGFVGLLLAISGPSMVIAWLKLRQRNLGPLLDANGWAMNSPAKINVPFGGSLTKVATLPTGSTRDLADPFAEKSQPWGVWAALVAVVLLTGAWYLGKLDSLLPLSARSVEVMGEKAPAYVPPLKVPAAVVVPVPAPAPAPAPTPAPAPKP
jgi:hypothetical protein